MDYEELSDYGISSDDSDDGDDASSSRAGTESGAASSSALPASECMDSDVVQEPGVAETAMPRALVERMIPEKITCRIPRHPSLMSARPMCFL